MVTEQEAVSLANRAVAKQGIICEYHSVMFFDKDNPFAQILDHEHDVWMVTYSTNLDGREIDPDCFVVKVDAVTRKVRIIEAL